MVDDNRARLIAAIASRMKILIDEDDPAFVIVELNRLMMDQAIRDLIQTLRAMEGRISNLPTQAIFTTPSFTDSIAKSISHSVITHLRASNSAQNIPRHLHILPVDWKGGASKIVVAAAVIAALVMSALAVAYSIHNLGT